MTKAQLTKSLKENIKTPLFEDAKSKLDELKSDIESKISSAKDDEEKQSLQETLIKIDESITSVEQTIEKNADAFSKAISTYVDQYVANLFIKSNIKVKTIIGDTSYTGSTTEQVFLSFKQGS